MDALVVIQTVLRAGRTFTMDGALGHADFIASIPLVFARAALTHNGENRSNEESEEK